MRALIRSGFVSHWALVGAVLLASVRLVTNVSAGTEGQAVKPDSERAAHMRVHFAQVMTVHEAVIRGDLAAVKPAAIWLAEHDAPASLPAGSAPLVSAMRHAAKSAAEAPTILAAAAATASMLRTCGDCHRAVGTMPAAPIAVRPEVGGIVGHMLEHQQAVDKMVQGLIIPSSSMWREGAESFKKASLHPSQLPRDPKLTGRVKASEERIHQLASQAVEVEDPVARAVFYGQILARCADCHSLHREVWGPARR